MYCEVANSVNHIEKLGSFVGKEETFLSGAFEFSDTYFNRG